MTTAPDLLRAYLAAIRQPASAAALFAPDGVLELPWVGVRAQGPHDIQRLVSGLLVKMPAFGFKNQKFWIETPDKAFAEYEVEAPIVATGRVYRQTYAGLLIAEGGKIRLLREALDTEKARVMASP